MPRNLRRGQRDPDFAAMKILSCLKELELQDGAARMSRRPLALVFTKVDQVEGCRENPEEFARMHAVGTWQYCRGNFATMPSSPPALSAVPRGWKSAARAAAGPRCGSNRTGSSSPSNGCWISCTRRGDDEHRRQSRQAHAAHHKFEKSCAAASESEAAAIRCPSDVLDADSPEVVARLEALDDAVFDAIQGKAAALAELHELWPALKVELGEALLAESREQYIRYALSIWQEAGRASRETTILARAVNALEVLCVLFDEVR